MANDACNHPAIRIVTAMALTCLTALVATPAAATGGSPATTGSTGSVITLKNPGFETGVVDRSGNPEGWVSIQHAGDLSYRFEPDEKIQHGGQRSLRITDVGREPFGSLYQILPASRYRNRVLVFSAWLRTQDAVGNRYGRGAALKLQAMKAGYSVAHNHGKDVAVGGTSDWIRREVSLLVPADAEQIEVGVTLFGSGAVWIDDAELRLKE